MALLPVSEATPTAPEAVIDHLTRMATPLTLCASCRRPLGDTAARTTGRDLPDRRHEFRFTHPDCPQPAAPVDEPDETAQCFAYALRAVAGGEAMVLITPDADRVTFDLPEDEHGAWRPTMPGLLAGNGWQPLTPERPPVLAGWAQPGPDSVQCVTMLGTVHTPADPAFLAALARQDHVAVIACTDWPIPAGVGEGIDPAVTWQMLASPGTLACRVPVLPPNR